MLMFGHSRWLSTRMDNRERLGLHGSKAVAPQVGCASFGLFLALFGRLVSASVRALSSVFPYMKVILSA